MDTISNSDINSVLKRTLELIEDRVETQGNIKISTGFESLDAILGGFSEGELVAIAARPAIGKSTLLMNMAISSIVNNSEYPVVICTGAASASSYLLRVFNFTCGCDHRKFATGNIEDEDWPRLDIAMRQLKDEPLYIVDDIRSPFDLEKLIQRINEKHKKPPVIFIDGLHQVKVVRSVPFDVQQEQVIYMLKNIAVSFRSPIVFTTPVARSCEEKECKIPEVHELHEIIESERLINKILCIYRDEVYEPDSTMAGFADIVILKNDQGQTGTVVLAFKGRNLRFSAKPYTEYY